MVPGFESCGEAASVGCQIVHFHLLPADFQPQVSPCPELPHVVVGTLVSSWTWANDCVCGSDGLGGQTRISPPQAPAQARPASYHTSVSPQTLLGQVHISSSFTSSSQAAQFLSGGTVGRRACWVGQSCVLSLPSRAPPRTPCHLPALSLWALAEAELGAGVGRSVNGRQAWRRLCHHSPGNMQEMYWGQAERWQRSYGVSSLLAFFDRKSLRQ